jgi:hypothetical protein
MGLPAQIGFGKIQGRYKHGKREAERRARKAKAAAEQARNDSEMAAG